MEYMQKLLFFANLKIGTYSYTKCTEVLKCERIQVPMRKKTQAFIISENVTLYALIQNPASIRSLRVNAKKNFQQM